MQDLGKRGRMRGGADGMGWKGEGRAREGVFRLCKGQGEGKSKGKVKG